VKGRATEAEGGLADARALLARYTDVQRPRDRALIDKVRLRHALQHLCYVLPCGPTTRAAAAPAAQSRLGCADHCCLACTLWWVACVRSPERAEGFSLQGLLRARRPP